MGTKGDMPEIEYDIRLIKVLKDMELDEGKLILFQELFNKYDTNKNNLLDFQEFVSFIDSKNKIAKSYTDALFRLVKIENTEELTFSEFLHGLVTYCMFSPDDLLKFCFYIFDKNRNGIIEKNEIKLLVEMLYADAEKGNAPKAIETLKRTKLQDMHFDEFRELNKKYPILLYPAFRLQAKIQTKIFGMRWWKKRIAKMQSKRQIEDDEHERVLAASRQNSLHNLQAKARFYDDNAPSTLRNIWASWARNSFTGNAAVQPEPEVQIKDKIEEEDRGALQTQGSFRVFRRFSMVRQWSSRMKGFLVSDTRK